MNTNTRNSISPVTIALLALILLATLAPPNLQGATITVTNTADSGAGTLRAALASAVNGDTINFAVPTPGKITLTNGELLITKSVSILGPGPTNLAVDGNSNSRVFHIVPSNTVMIVGLTITNGLATGNANSGGGIYNDSATLAVVNCALRGNAGGLDLFGNQGSGGGICNRGSFLGNARLNLTNTTLSGNSGFNGGGIFAGAAIMRIINSTLNGNSAVLYGGAVYGDNGSMAEVANSTLSGNNANYGGGIYNSGNGNSNMAGLRIVNSTLAGNKGFGGNIHNLFGSVEIGNTILGAGPNSYSEGFFSYSAGAGVTSLGYNLSSDNSAGLLTNATDRSNIDPGLGPLQDNGGPTPTHALLCGSPAFDKGNRNLIPALASNTDQRGLPRPFDNPDVGNAAGGDGSDIGAFERQDSCAECVTTLTVTTSQDGVPGSLREAILIANACPGRNVIEFAPSAYGRILLTQGTLLITDDLCINGPGAATLSVDGNHASRVFHVKSNTVVTIAGLSITNGFVFSSASDQFAAGIWNERATLAVNDCALQGNTAQLYGGGIFNDHGSLTVSNSMLGENSLNSNGRGGAIYNDGSFFDANDHLIATNGASLKMINCTVRGSTPDAIYQHSYRGTASAQIVHCTLTDTAGRAIFNWGPGPESIATVDIIGSTICSNRSAFTIQNYSGPGTLLRITNCTVSGNSAEANLAVIYNGEGAALRLVNSTITGNSSGSLCIYNAGNAEIGSTILDAAPYSFTFYDADPSGITSLGYNLSSDDARGHILTNATDLLNTDPLLGPLQDNGGPVFTHAFASCSPAIDHGKNFTGVAIDSRGLPRSVDDPLMANAAGGDGTDIGAFEAQGHVPDITPPTVVCPADIFANETPGAGTRVVTYAASVSDNCDPNPMLSCTPPSGSALAIGTTTVTCRATDSVGNSNECSFAVTICPITITVTTTNDDGPGSLRQAILDANACAGKNVIEFAPSAYGTILLTSGELLITDELDIHGPGVTNMAVDGNASSGIFHIAGADVSLSRLTITNGNASDGGGLWNQRGTALLTNVVLSGNAAFSGGGILNDGYSGGSGTLILINSRIVGNSAVGGAGIQNGGEQGDATLLISNCVINGNTGGGGGAIRNSGRDGIALVILADTTLNGNTTDGGGGILNDHGGVQIVNSTLSDNSGGSNGGGGLFNYSGSVCITNSTFSGNFVDISAGAAGGAILNYVGGGTSSVCIVNSTFSGNNASVGGSIENEGGDGSAILTVASTIFHSGAAGGTINSFFVDTITSLGFNLSSDDGGGFLTNATDRINTDPLLGPLQDNSGPTWTHALLCGSPAIDKGKNFSGLTTDQRGLPRASDRPQNPNAAGGDGSDIGAFEVQQFCTPFLSNFGVTSNRFGFSVNAESNQLAVVESSTNLTIWTALATNTVGGVPLRFTDSTPADLPKRFYRARTQ